MREAVEKLVDGINCNDGSVVLHERLLHNGRRSPRFVNAIMSARQRFLLLAATAAVAADLAHAVHANLCVPTSLWLANILPGENCNGITQYVIPLRFSYVCNSQIFA